MGVMRAERGHVRFAHFSHIAIEHRIRDSISDVNMILMVVESDCRKLFAIDAMSVESLWLWHPNHPHLYTLTTMLFDGDIERVRPAAAE
jgi:hypothetical protein